MDGSPQFETLITNAHVVCMDSAFTQYRSGFVAISGTCISAVGDMADCPDAASAGEVVDAAGCAVIPGLINCHTHLPMVYFRGIADDLPLMKWLTEHIFPAEGAHLTAEFVHRATLLAAAECIRGGVTCVNDMYLFAQQVGEACAEAGLRAFTGEGVIKFPTPSAAGWEEGFRLEEQLIERFSGHDLITPSVCGHAPYTATPEILKKLRVLADKHGLLFHIHLHETKGEPGQIDWREGGESPTEGMARLGMLDGRFIGAHGVWLSDSDIKSLAAHRKCAIAHCPCSNLKLASGVAPLAKMQDAGLKVGLGTDGAASNNNLDMLEELHIAALLQKGVQLDAELVPARTALRLATSGAAEALGMDYTGVLAEGMRADIAVIDLGGVHLTPRYHHDDAIYSHIVYAAQSADVRDTMVNGKWLMRSRKLTALDEQALKTEAQDWLNRSYPA